MLLRGSRFTKAVLSNFKSHSIASRCQSTAAQQKIQLGKDQKFSPGKVYSGFLCKRVQFIPDFNMTAMIFEHEKTGLQYIHVDRNDSNNLFSVNFRTTPFNSSGLPHILEHNVLCGSEKFPVRDPFFKMLNRSLATFMNAMTGPDYTLYPFSSTNEKDYRNLQSIYMDAVFRPNLKYLDFLQEGWRLEHKELENKNSEYIFKGVVYNEMKGAFSENSAIFGQNMFNKMLPEHSEHLKLTNISIFKTNFNNFQLMATFPAVIQLTSLH
jgi:presequence protease